MASKILPTMLIMILNSNAHQKLLTWKLSTRALANNMITVLITNKNKPKVSMVIGNDTNCNTGFKMAFKIPNTMATIIAVPKLLTEIPGNNQAVKYTATLDISICKIKFITFIFIDLLISNNP